MNDGIDSLIKVPFSWFQGIVEDVQDPQQLGRVRVRCVGYHSASRLDIPTSSLPWASLVLSVTSSSMAHVGESGTGLQPGSWVFGFFRDGASAQDPVILGSLASVSSKVDKSSGFSDPSGMNPTVLGPDIPLEATSNYAQSDSYIARVSNSKDVVETAVGSSWSIPDVASTVAPRYPANQVKRTASGHILELDDTPGQERVAVIHKSGTRRETLASGDNVVVVVGDGYEVTIGDRNILVKGNANVTIAGNATLLVNGNMTQSVKGDMSLTVGGNMNVTVSGDKVESVSGDLDLTVDGSKTENVSGVDSFIGSPINLNS
jgi:hypothetical protein